MHREVVAIRRTGARVDSVVVAGEGGEEEVPGDHFISSMPVTELVLRLSPPPPAPVREAARRLSYRDFLTVCLIVDRPDPFPDNWIYVHSPEVKVGRIQNFRSWSPDMVPDPGKASLGLEYFCTEGDALWTMPDAELIPLGKQELERIGLARASDIADGCVFRVPKAYPVYDATYREHLDTVREFVDGLENLQTIGRNGLHRYNNQDHAMLTGLLAVRNLAGGERHDLWSVNTEQEYHEEVGVAEAEAVALEGRITEIFPRIDGVALGGATGLVAGALLCPRHPVPGPQGRARRRAPPGPARAVPPRLYRHRRRQLLGLLYGFARRLRGGLELRAPPQPDALLLTGLPPPPRPAAALETLPRVRLGGHAWRVTRRTSRPGARTGRAAQCGRRGAGHGAPRRPRGVRGHQLARPQGRARGRAAPGAARPVLHRLSRVVRRQPCRASPGRSRSASSPVPPSCGSTTSSPASEHPAPPNPR